MSSRPESLDRWTGLPLWILYFLGLRVSGTSLSLHFLGSVKQITDIVSDQAERTTFFSLHVWNPNREALAWNPGNQDPSVGQVIWDHVYEIYRQIPIDSPRYTKLDEVLFALLHSTSAMDYGSDANWFDDRTPP